MADTIFITGGSGFVGSAVVDEVVRRGFLVHALTTSKPLDDRGGKVKSFSGGLFDTDALDGGLGGCTAVIHLVGIIMENASKGVTFERIHFEGTKSIVDATKRVGIRRYVQMSALGARPDAISEYHETKWNAEEYVRASGMNSTIIRPSMIHGPKGEFMKMEAAWAKKQKMPFLFMPYFGAGLLGTSGGGKIQPVFVDDVARAFADALEKPQTIGQTYEIGGPDVMDWPTMHRMVARVLTGKSRLTMPIPAWYAKAITYVAPPSLLPFNKAQVIMSQEDNVCDLGKLERDFGWEPQGFEATLGEYGGRIESMSLD